MAPLSEGLILRVRLTPRAGRDEVTGIDADGVVHARVAAAPADGAANAALVKLLAAALEVPRTSIELVGGTASRQKRVRIRALDAEGIAARWPGAVVREG